MREVLTAVMGTVERRGPGRGENGLWFGASEGDWYVQVSFDGFAEMRNEKYGQRRNGRIPKDLLPRVTKLLPGLPEPSLACNDDDADLPF